MDPGETHYFHSLIGSKFMNSLCLAVPSRRAPYLSGEFLVGNTSRRACALLDVFPPRHSTLRAGRPSSKGTRHREFLILRTQRTIRYVSVVQKAGWRAPARKTKIPWMQHGVSLKTMVLQRSVRNPKHVPFSIRNLTIVPMTMV